VPGTGTRRPRSPVRYPRCGSFYYIAYAAAKARLLGAEQVWAAGFVAAVSVVVHRIAALPMMARLDLSRQAHGDHGARPGRGIDE
jgi:hypothetical protein